MEGRDPAGDDGAAPRPTGLSAPGQRRPGPSTAGMVPRFSVRPGVDAQGSLIILRGDDLIHV